MHQKSTIPVREGICVVRGFGVKVRVSGAHLVCEDGIAELRRESRFNRATCGIRRLVIESQDGYISLDALRWVQGIGASFVVIDSDGAVILASGSRNLDESKLRRAQALAATNGTGIDITRSLIEAKLRGQSELLRELGSDSAFTTVEGALTKLRNAGDAVDVRIAEALAAIAYWGALSSIEVQFAAKDRERIPKHWQTFGSRASELTGAPRRATNPANAMLNYLYAILEAETRIACQSMGLDPGIGFLHTDEKSKDSLSLDLMEPIRPCVDRMLIDMLKRQTFQANDFLEEPRGTVRMASTVRQRLSSAFRPLAREVAPCVERVAQSLVRSATKRAVPTPLSQSNRSSGRDGYRHGERDSEKSAVERTANCERCGNKLVKTKRRFCNFCVDLQRKEQLPSFERAGIESMARKRASGEDPSHGGEAALRRAETQKQRREQQRKWEAEHSENLDEARERFIRDVLPELQAVPLSRIQEATGLGLRYTSLIRRGQCPHPRHFAALRSLSQSPC